MNDIKLIILDGSKYPYKSKKKRLVKKWTKQHTKEIRTFKNCRITSTDIEQSSQTLSSNSDSANININIEFTNQYC